MADACMKPYLMRLLYCRIEVITGQCWQRQGRRQAAFSSARDRPANRAAIFMRLLQALATFGETALHAATTEQHRDAPFDAHTKAVAVFELPALLIGFARGRLGAAPLRDAHQLDALLLARHHVCFAEEAAIRSI